MPTYIPPRSDADRLSLLKKALETGTLDRDAGYLYLDQELLDELRPLVNELEAALNLVVTRQSGLSKEVRERLESIDRVQAYTRDLWEGLRRRVARLKQPAEVLTFYKLPLDGTTPNPGGMDSWLTLAAQVVEGDRQAVAAGHPAMVNPSAEELAAVIEAARKEAGEVAPADRALATAQEQVAQLRTKSDAVIEEIAAQLRYTLRKKEASSQRRVMRSYGMVFAYTESESGLEQDETPQDADIPADSSAGAADGGGGAETGMDG